MEACKAACLRLPYVECVGFDFDPNQRACYIHTAATIDNVESSRQQVDQFLRNPCQTTTGPTGKCASWAWKKPIPASYLLAIAHLRLGSDLACVLMLEMAHWNVFFHSDYSLANNLELLYGMKFVLASTPRLDIEVYLLL